VKKHLIILSLIYIINGSLISAQEEAYSVKKANFSSDRYDEFSPVYYNGGLVFCSDQNSRLLFSYSTPQNEGLFKINYIDTTRWSNSNVRLFSSSITSRFNDGPVTFSPGRDTIYFSRNIVVEGGLKEISGNRNKLGLFYAVLEGDKWTNITGMRFNSDSYNNTTPFLSPDGRQLYFASDRPDGFGGSDLFMCRWTNGYWSNPENLGPVVNTKGNEAYPFINQNGEIFFSSDGHEGLGGKDIFFSKFVNSEWITPVRLEAPVNSRSNDFGFISDESNNSGYFSTDREGSIDIYSFSANIPRFFFCGEQRKNSHCFSFPDDISIDIDPLNLQFEWDFGDGGKETGYVVNHCYQGSGKYSVKQNIIDKKTGRVVYNKLSLELEIENLEQPFIVAEDIVIKNEPVSFDAGESYFPGRTVISYHWDFGDGEKASGDVVTHLYAGNGEYNVRLGVRLKDTGSGKISQDCVSKKIIVINQIADSLSVTSPDSVAGESGYLSIFENDQLKIDTVYSSSAETQGGAIFEVVIQSSKTQINLNTNTFEQIIPKYTLREKFIPGEDLFNYVIDKGINFMDVYPSYADAVALGFKDAVIKTYIPSDSAEMELWNIVKTYGISSDEYFAARDSRLISENFPVLDQLAVLMKNYPEVVLRIAVHTDNTGSSSSNLSLSLNRARSIVSYLVSKGIATNRLIPAGYGGTRPIASNYSEADRKKNRRLELIIMNIK
jgi:outer membrane protein OmpA-like peptidoglycan-associated protein